MKNKLRLNIPEDVNIKAMTSSEYQQWVAKYSKPVADQQYQKNQQKPVQKRDNPEHRIQAAYFKILKLNEEYFPDLEYIYANANGGRRGWKTAKDMKSEGVKRGVPDIFIPIPTIKILTEFKLDYLSNTMSRKKVLDGFCGCYLETKTKTGSLSPEQKRYKPFLMSKEYKYVVCRSTEELVLATETYLGITFKIKQLPSGNVEC